MSYFTGKNLDRKVHEYDLAMLDTLLAGIANGTEAWPGTLGAVAPADSLETLRVVIYSMIHKYGLKNEFVVKMDVAKSIVTINFKYAPAKKRRIGGVQRVDTMSNDSLPTIHPGDTLDERMDGLFDETDSLLTGLTNVKEGE